MIIVFLTAVAATFTIHRLLPTSEKIVYCVYLHCTP